MTTAFMAKNAHVCSYHIAALGAGGGLTVTFPRGVNRLIISSLTSPPAMMQWSPTANIPGAVADAADPTASGGIRVVGGPGGYSTIIEIEKAVNVWTFRNPGAAALDLVIEGHVIGGFH